MKCIVQNYKMTENQMHGLAQIMTKAACCPPKICVPFFLSNRNPRFQLGTWQHQIQIILSS